MRGRDVLAILPTGFGKSMIFTVYTLAKKEMMKLSAINDCCSILVVSPQMSIIMGPFINYVGGGGDKRMGCLQIFEGKWGEVARKLQVEGGRGHINYIHTKLIWC